jgi:hypothetical protein
VAQRLLWTTKGSPGLQVALGLKRGLRLGSVGMEQGCFFFLLGKEMHKRKLGNRHLSP